MILIENLSEKEQDWLFEQHCRLLADAVKEFIISENPEAEKEYWFYDKH